MFDDISKSLASSASRGAREALTPGLESRIYATIFSR